MPIPTVLMDKTLAEEAAVDIVSCQFALHYSCYTEGRVQRTLANVSAMLGPGPPGGTSIGTMAERM
ncbi:hypothetical protein DVH24_042062 [Malus domestica]|uniref:mRNA (guanine-N(7))-methyltransferase n=1 Tax=Malus domestica TaxID=3750 RepID=A0A498ISX8_MALDO|nr:hypothetical protein DVH24_042062 [Malus domestica]